MRVKLLSILAVLLIALMACQGTDDAQRGTNSPNIDPTTNRNTGIMDSEGIFNNDQDYTLMRDADRNQRGFGRDDRMSNNRNNDNNNSRYDIAEEAAERITDEIDEIDDAYVITTENNAYVAAELENDNRANRNERGNRTENGNQNNHFRDDEIENELKERIAKIVQSVDSDIENVYVSTNPDFIDLVDDYADDADDGRPIGGFLDQLEIMIERIFPENAGQ